MTITRLVLTALIAVLSGACVQQGHPGLAPGIEWAFGYKAGTEGRKVVSPLANISANDLMRIPGSKFAFPAITFDRHDDGRHEGEVPIADWYPEDRGKVHMPDVVRRGRKLFNPDGTWTGTPGIRACGFCHLANGAGRPENAQPAGYSKAYIRRQLTDLKSGLRNSADAKNTNVPRMASFARLLTQEETEAVIEYFAAQSYPPVGMERYIRVVEADMVPVATGGILSRILPGTGEEPLGDRIFEVPSDDYRDVLRDGKGGYIAYVPIGSVRKGEALAIKLRCALCHGPELNGSPIAPPIAGRSPHYLARQLYGFQTGARRGIDASLMRPIAATLTSNDMLNLVAYASSIAPKKKHQ